MRRATVAFRRGACANSPGHLRRRTIIPDGAKAFYAALTGRDPRRAKTGGLSGTASAPTIRRKATQ
jgi:hypothetical protein